MHDLEIEFKKDTTRDTFWHYYIKLVDRGFSPDHAKEMLQDIYGAVKHDLLGKRTKNVLKYEDILA